MDHYIGLDAHSKTCTFVSLDKDGVMLNQGKFKTSERNLVSTVKSLQGKKALVLEESNLAQWIYVTLKDQVDELVICHPTYLPKKSGPKNDFRDAVHLAHQLRTNNLTPVFHEDNFMMNLRTVVSHYQDAVIQYVRLVNQYKALLRSEGILNKTHQGAMIEQEQFNLIKKPTTRFVAAELFAQIHMYRQIRKRYVEEFTANIKSTSLLRNLASVPGMGPVRANVVAAIVCNGTRFQTKHQFWSYAMLVRHWNESDGHIISRRTPHGRRELKGVFMGAAQRIIGSSTKTGLKDYYLSLREKRGLDEKKSRKALARKIAAICLMAMKTGKKYDDKIVRDSFKK